MIHFTFEAPFLYLSMFGRTVNTSTGVFAELCKSLHFCISSLGIHLEEQGRNIPVQMRDGEFQIRMSYHLSC